MRPSNNYVRAEAQALAAGAQTRAALASSRLQAAADSAKKKLARRSRARLKAPLRPTRREISGGSTRSSEYADRSISRDGFSLPLKVTSAASGGIANRVECAGDDRSQFHAQYFRRDRLPLHVRLHRWRIRLRHELLWTVFEDRREVLRPGRHPARRRNSMASLRARTRLRGRSRAGRGTGTRLPSQRRLSP